MKKKPLKYPEPKTRKLTTLENKVIRRWLMDGQSCDAIARTFRHSAVTYSQIAGIKSNMTKGR